MEFMCLGWKNVTRVLPKERYICVKYKVMREEERTVTLRLEEDETKISCR